MDGVTVMETSEAVVTFRVVVAEVLPDVAVIVAVPLATPVALPSGAIVTFDVSEEIQVTTGVRS